MKTGTAARIAVMSAALSVAHPVQAQQTIETSHDVAVALVDVGVNGLASSDPNVRFIDLTPAPREGFRHASRKVGGMEHAEMVSRSFVDEYRRMDPQARITFYTVNPFIQKGANDPMMFSRAMLQQALPKLKDTKVRVAITTFGVSDQAAGDKILKDFQDSGLIVFAATPNHREDDGIWPAANKSTISVADGVTPDSGFLHNGKWAAWVDFTANGGFHYGSVDSDGSSFATPRVAAYGAFVALAKPNIDVAGMKAVIARTAVTVRIHDRDFPKVGTDRAPEQVREQVAALSREAPTQVAAVTPRPDAGAIAARMAMGGGMGH